MKFDIPSELTNMIADRRVIPFIGAGFSAVFNLPNWEDLLAEFAKEIRDTITYDEVKEMCNDDPLQIAEYYYLKSGSSIGPIRHAISKALTTKSNPILSGSHVELVNLGSPQIYTTNYEDLIETTFRNIGLDHDIIALPKDLATSKNNVTQIVKYHGDLRHESTLVLTESSYYSRLDFEAPMDLKFRSDLLGKSVLFIGYSFRDINIRIIWFKLMQMMKDIPLEDRPKSYIVRLEPNPVLERLYEGVGIKTIVLNPKGDTKTKEQKSLLLADFMFELAYCSSNEGFIPGTSNPMFFSESAHRNIIEEFNSSRSFKRMKLLGNHRPLNINIILSRQIPNELENSFKELLLHVAESGRPSDYEPIINSTLNILTKREASIETSSIIARGLARADTREIILSSRLKWSQLLGTFISKQTAELLLDYLESEIEGHEENSILDMDLAYLVDIAFRIKLGQIMDISETEVINNASKLIGLATLLYDQIAIYEPIPFEKPNITLIKNQIEERIIANETESETESETVS